MDKHSIDYYLPNWSKEKLFDKKSFDELLNLDDISLWWFVKKYFFKYAMPRNINTYTLMQDNLKINFSKHLSLVLHSKFLQNFIFYNEMLKLKLSKKQPSGKEVLFLSYTNHISNGKIFRIQEILDQIENPLVLFANPLSSKVSKNLNTIYSFADKNLIKKAKTKAKKLNSIWKSLDKTKIPKWNYLQYNFNLFFSYELLFLFILNYEIYKKIINKQNIKVAVLTAPHNIFEKCLLAALEQKRIPSILVQHGLGMAGANPELLSNTKCAVFGDITKNELIKIGVNANSILKTGPIIFDKIIKYKKKVKNDKLEIFLATTPAIEDASLSANEYWNYLKKIINDLIKVPNSNLTIKLHPLEKGYDKYIELTKNYNNILVIKNQDRDLYFKTLNKSNVFLHFDSTAAIEAMILEKPTINIKILKDDIKLITDKYNLVATPSDNLDKKVLEVINMDFKTKEFLHDLCGDLDGNSTKRVVDLILKLK